MVSGHQPWYSREGDTINDDINSIVDYAPGTLSAVRNEEIIRAVEMRLAHIRNLTREVETLLDQLR